METKSTFEGLEVWQEARALRSLLAVICKGLPDVERFRLADQLVRASRSVTANIAEGYGRYHYRENMQFCRQARGSLYEILDHLTVALDERYLENSQFDGLRTSVYQLIKKLNGYIRYLQNRKDLTT